MTVNAEPQADRTGAHPAEDGARPMGPILVVANRKSGTNARDSAAISRALEVFRAAGEEAELMHWNTSQDLARLLQSPEASRAATIVSAGGDGTAMALAGALLGRDTAFAALPLGTFNYFARGLGLSEDPETAARQILASHPARIKVGTVNGTTFLNNASLGIYPAILKERERIYSRWGRRRLMAHWSVLKTFLRFQKPMKLTLETTSGTRECRTPLLFVARSAYQLDLFGLAGAGAISRDEMAVLVGCGRTRIELFLLAWRLVTRQMREGRDYELIETSRLRVDARARDLLLAYDGEKRKEPVPLDFAMSEGHLVLRMPKESAPE